MNDLRGKGDSAFPRQSRHAPNNDARFPADVRSGAFSTGFDLHRAGSWSNPSAATMKPQANMPRGVSPHGVGRNPRAAFPERQPPKRTMTDDPGEFLLRSIHSEWSDDPSFAWPSMRGSALHTEPIHSSAGMPRVGSLSRSQTLDADPPMGARPTRGFGHPANLSLSGSAIGSPRGLASPDWATKELDTTWLPPRPNAASLAGAPHGDMYMGTFGTGTLSSSPDDDGTMLHQQQNAEASVAMALGDDLTGPRTLSMSPTSMTRIGAPGDPPVSPSPTERELARQMRSLTLPSETPADTGVSGPLLRDSPPVASSGAFPSRNMRNARPEAFPRKPTRHHTLNFLDQNTHKSTGAFPVFPSGPFGAEPRASLTSPTGEYGNSSLFSPPYSPEAKPRGHEEPVPFGMFAPPPTQPLDPQGMYFGTHPAASPRQAKGGDLNRPAWFGAPGTLRLGDLTTEVPDLPIPDANGTPYVPYRYPPATFPRELRARGFDVPPSAAAASTYEPLPRRHTSGRRHASEGRHDRHNRRNHHEEREHTHELGARFELHDVLGRMVDVSTDQHGSRLIQEKLDHCTKDERDLVFAELYPESRRLMTDVFGNYVIQKMLEYGSPEQVRALGQQLQGHVLSLSLGTYGCRVVQKAFEHVNAEQKVALSRELEPYVLDCVRDQNANHVIQKILERVPSAHLDFVSSAFAGHVPMLASHCYSCRVLQRIFAYCSEEQRRPLLEEMHEDTLRLMQDQYGNYVIQWVLQRGEARDRIEIVRKTKTHLLQLARHKFASNVVEHVIEVAPPNDLDDLLDELFSPIDATDASTAPPLPENAKHCVATVMMQDQYANYVLQRFLQVVQGEGRQRLIATIRPALQALRQLATPVSGPGAPTSHMGAIRLPGGGHVGSKPLLTIERLIDQVSNAPDRTSTTHQRGHTAHNTN